MISGHLFIVNSDLTKIACDAILVPTDKKLNIESHWKELTDTLEFSGPFDSFVLPTTSKEGRKPQRHVWLGNIGQPRDDSDYSVFVPALREFILAAKAELELDRVGRIYEWPRLRLAVNVIGSGKGGAKEVQGELLKGLVRTLDNLTSDFDVDIVLVAFGAKQYAAAQWARRQLVEDVGRDAMWSFHETANRELRSKADAMAEAANTKHLVLFIGAGVSAGAGAPNWGGLLSEMAEKAGFTADQLKALPGLDARDQATLIDRRLRLKGGSLSEAVGERLSAIEMYSLQHSQLASLPSAEAVTTNFDVLFELAVRTHNTLAVLPESPRIADRWLLKLHGTVDIDDSIVLTRSDYLDMPRQYGALMGLVQAMLLMRHMMFIGYSLKDEDFQELIHEVRSARGDKAGDVGGTVFTLFDDDLQRELWAPDLAVVPMMACRSDQGISDEVAARELEMFLDLVGYESTTSATFFLDEDFKGLTEDDSDLRDVLWNLAHMTDAAQPGEVGYLIKTFLKELGSDHRPTRRSGER